MKTEKKRRFCRFDAVILLIVLVLGAAVWFLSRGGTEENAMTDVQLLEDLRRCSDRYTDQEKLTEIEYYNVDYIVKLTGISASEQEALPEPGTDMYESWSGCPVGTLEKCTWTENADGTFDAELTILQYALFTKLKITTPSGTQLRVGKALTLRAGEDQTLTTGVITWISH